MEGTWHRRINHAEPKPDGRLRVPRNLSPVDNSDLSESYFADGPESTLQ